ncbi:hypothetical protein BKD03_01580 [Brucella sp. 09RB8471]|nr:hypothetical protein BKD03_01580 [Brucella sp. 09RB8471]
MIPIKQKGKTTCGFRMAVMQMSGYQTCIENLIFVVRKRKMSVVEMNMLGRFNHRVAALPQRPANSFFPDKTVYSARPVQLRVTFFGCN